MPIMFAEAGLPNMISSPPNPCQIIEALPSHYAVMDSSSMLKVRLRAITLPDVCPPPTKRSVS
jgi:hypothetical protein